MQKEVKNGLDPISGSGKPTRSFALTVVSEKLDSSVKKMAFAGAYSQPPAGHGAGTYVDSPPPMME